MFPKMLFPLSNLSAEGHFDGFIVDCDGMKHGAEIMLAYLVIGEL